MITHAVSKHLRWRIDHPHLYEYLTLHPLSDDVSGVAAIREVNSAVAGSVAGQLEGYFWVVGLSEVQVEPLSFGIVGFVESATTHWLNNSAPPPLAEFTAQLAEWIWALLSNTLQSAGIRLDPREPIAAPPRET
jgi:hypothetical protein